MFVLFGGFCVLMSLIDWFLRDFAETEDSVIYWLVASREPYIPNDEKRHQHFEFKGVMMLAFGIPFLLGGVLVSLVPPSLALEYGVLGGLAMALSALLLHLVFVADAAEKSREEDDDAEEAQTERLLEDEDHGRLRD
jgi:hypothetical protein